MLKLSQRDQELLPIVVNHAKTIISKDNQEHNETEVAITFIDFYEKYNDTDNKATHSEMKFIKNYLAVFRMNAEMAKKKDREKRRLENEVGKKRKVLNNSKFHIGGLFYELLNSDKSTMAKDKKVCYDALLFSMAKLMGIDEFCRSDWKIFYKGWKTGENENGVYFRIDMPKTHSDTKYHDYVFISFRNKNQTLIKADMYLREFDHANPENGKAKQTDYTEHAIDTALANFMLKALKNNGIIEYDELTKAMKLLWVVGGSGEQGELQPPTPADPKK